MNEDEMYEKCADCHLFVEVNETTPQEGVALFMHLAREGDEELEASHEPRPSGMRANLTAWRAYGPPAMRARFVRDFPVRAGA